MPRDIRLMQGNEACVEGALFAGMRFFAGYPITPSTEIAELSALRLPMAGGRFIQMEDEIASLAAVIGASVAGVKAMTATSGPGFSLMQENIGYAALAEIPCVIIDVQRLGPSTGMPTSPSQGDVMQARWGTHGDHPAIALAPASVRETYALTVRCFNLAERFRTPVILLMDEIVGHLREDVELPDRSACPVVDRQWDRTRGARGIHRVQPGEPAPLLPPFGEGIRYNITGLIHDDNGFPTNSHEAADAFCDRLLRKVEDHRDEIVQTEAYRLDDAEVGVFCYGGTTRSVMAAIDDARDLGLKVGMFRPVTVWPFPDQPLQKEMEHIRRWLVVEHNGGQLLQEVRRVAGGRCTVDFLGRLNGTVITPDEVSEALRRTMTCPAG